ncbi:MAG TPA: hypothetical protein VHO93_04815 [Actinomycetota bacterium]|nr:hypothetical protein [Actinomycetota bacterium]
MPRLRLAMIVLLAAALAAAGCTFGDDEPSTAPQPASKAGAAQGRLDLKGVCPDPIVVQTDWFPETEYGVYYHMLGPNPKVDTKRKLVRGALIAEGQETGVQLEVRSGGPATDFKLVSEQMYTDKSITLGQVNTDEAVRFASNQPTLSVVAPMEISPFMIMWDPNTYPEFNIIADIGQTNAKVLYFKGDTYMEYLIGAGILRKGQIDDSYDGSSTKFVAGKGATTQAGFATSEPYIYATDLPEWRKPLSYALVNDTGYPFYPQALSIRAADKQKLAPCLEKLVPIVQRAQIDFLQNPNQTNKFIIDTVKAYNTFWTYSPGLANYAIGKMRQDFVNNGGDRTLGNFEVGRIQRLIDIVTPILVGQRQPTRPGLQPQDLYTNEFVDPSIGVVAS